MVLKHITGISVLNFLLKTLRRRIRNQTETTIYIYIYRNSINISFDDYDTAPCVVHDEMRDAFKGSDFDWSKSQSGTLGGTQKGLDFDSTDQIDLETVIWAYSSHRSLSQNQSSLQNQR